MKNIFSILLVSLLSLNFSVFSQDISGGKIYRIHNIGKPGQTMSVSAAVSAAVGASSDASDLRQQWYLTANQDNSGFYMRNVATGAYLSSPLAIYIQWPLVYQTEPTDANMLMSISDYEGNKVIKAKNHNNNYAYAHNDGSNSIVCWLASSTPTQWQFEEVNYSQGEIEAILKKFENTAGEIAKESFYQSHLEQLFSDFACTSLQETGDLSSNSHYQALSPTLRSMADKVKTGVWSENKGDWDSSHAKKYRVQLYEPYSEGSAASSFAGIQAYTNMNNPTGILADSGDIIYVMVDENPADGSTLYISGVPDCSMYNNATNGTKLKKGLNMILCNADNTHYFIYYTVNTVQGKQRIRKVTAYDPIKIHIEGGRINGFFNYVGDELYSPDTEADYRYTIERATHPMYDLIGKYVILHFFKEDTPDTPQSSTLQLGVKSSLDPERNPGATKRYDPVQIMKAWDDMCFSERILMGIQSDEDIRKDFNQGMYRSIVGEPLTSGEYSINLQEPYSDYFNNRMMGITLQAAGLYMNATAWRTAYAPSTISAILAQFPQNGIWGPAHEYGHMNQTPMRIAGTTEESNNVFSNVANYFLCHTTSRCDYPSSQLKIFNEGRTYLDHGTWGTTRMFWQLWCYYHATGHNTAFYPRLYELLRNYPLKRDLTSIPGKLNPKTDLLHFAKMCCIAAQEDLTNFFTSWGFFVPQDNYHIDDYDVYDCILTEEDIAEVKNEIKSYGFPPNNAIILIDDRPGSDLAAGFGYNKTLCGEYGGLKDFEQDKPASGDFTFTVDGSTVKVSGNGDPGVGYLIFDNEGNLIGFSNSDTFTLSPQAAADLVAGNATVKAVGTDNKTVDVVDPVRNGSAATKKNLLKDLIDRADALLALADESETKVGALYLKSCEGLQKLRNDTYTFWEQAGEEDSKSLTDAYLNLSDKYYALLNDPAARIPVINGAAYRLVNRQYTTKGLDASTEKCISTAVNPQNPVVPFSQQWIFESIDGNGNYYVKNLDSDLYLSTTKKQSTSIPLSSNPQSYSLITIEPGIYALAPDNDLRFGIHIDAGNNVVQWNTGSIPTQWTLVKTSSPELIALRQELSSAIEDAEQLLSTAGTSVRKDPLSYTFPADHLYTNAPYTGNNSDKFTSWNVLFDNNTATYFHSNYDNSKDSEDGLDHYIRMKSPDNSSFRFFELSYTTRAIDNTGTNPRSIVISASNDSEHWREIYHATGLPTGNAVTYSTGEIIAPENTSYIRFMVTGSGGSAHTHPYFVLSELRVEDLGEPVFHPDENFPYLSSADMQELYDEIKNGKIDLAYSAATISDLTSRKKDLDAAVSTLMTVMVPKVEVTSISIEVNPVLLQLGKEDVTVNAKVEPEDATFPQFEWTLEDNEVAEISSIDGKTVTLHPLKMGSTSLSVRVVESPLATASAIVKVLPEVPVESVVLVPGDLSVPLNATDVSIVAEIYPENASVKNLLWSSSDPTVAEIDGESGAITLVRAGNTIISAAATDGTEIWGSSSLIVTNAIPHGLLIYPEIVSIREEEELLLTATFLPADGEQPLMQWTSSDPSIVAVDPSGLIKGLSAGQAVITVTTRAFGADYSASAAVTVDKAMVKNISLSSLNLTIEKGNRDELSLSATPASSMPETVWTLSNPDVISMTVNPDGMSASLLALKPGMCTVTVTVPENESLSASCNVTVPEIAVTDIRFASENDTFDIEPGPQIISAVIYPEDAAVPRLFWQSSDERVIKLNPQQGLDCELVPVSNGMATVTVSHADRPEISSSRLIRIVGTSGTGTLFDDKDTPVDIYDASGKILNLQTPVSELIKLVPGVYIFRQGHRSFTAIVR